MTGASRISWEAVSHHFEPDGGYREISASGVDVSTWQRVLDALAATFHECSFFVDNEPVPPIPAFEIFRLHREQTFLLRVELGSTRFHSHFFAQNKINFDLDPRAINNQTDLDRLVDFMAAIAEVTGVEAVLSYEDGPRSRFVSIRPASMGENGVGQSLVTPRRVRMATEFGCSPLWVPGGDPCNVDPADLGIEADLVDDLWAWAAEWDSTLEETGPADSGFDSRSDWEMFHYRGAVLAERLKAALPLWVAVEYRFAAHSGESLTTHQIGDTGGMLANTLAGHSFPVSCRLEQMGDIFRMSVVPFRLVDLAIVLRQHIVHPVAVVSTGHTEIKPGTNELLDLEQIAGNLGIEAEKMDEDVFLVRQEDLKKLVDEVYWFDFVFADMGGGEPDPVDLYVKLNDVNWESSVLSSLPDSNFAAWSHDDCYLTVESRERGVLVDLARRLLGQLGVVAGAPNLGSPPDSVVEAILPEWSAVQEWSTVDSKGVVSIRLASTSVRIPVRPQAPDVVVGFEFFGAGWGPVEPITDW